MNRIATLLVGLGLAFALAVPAHASTGYTQTKYPIVLVHGLFGFDRALGVDYWYRIPAELQKDGAKVYVAQVSAVNSTEMRGEQLLSQVRQILAITGADKVNLIGHSHGGPTARYVSGVAPQLVASVATVGGVNKGSRIADMVRGALPAGSVSETVAAGVARGLAGLISLVSNGNDLPQDPVQALEALTTQKLADFNQRFPGGVPTSACGEGAYIHNGIRFYSWSGASMVTNIADPGDSMLGLMGLLYGNANDGLVSTCSSRLGQVIRDDYRMNHVDEINHFFGLVHLFETDPVTLYRQHANRLKNAGL
ncbi:esterase/lipase family protein [Chitinimonas sp. BJB300]|uniref:esterase/lipase family protein n=1 Tax=Chitinimonas sp. BJB300 TaxID=1559339 RepID=UPI000C0ED86A|nr:triacylglycerol lipase [Chitinimonas sp. BJB300]PHV10053.1 lipase [Chitinimonas sp. BJB300]TSJ91374.1 triacylglycerol lipase [Chitinimonas sp. BJB300]